MGVYDTLPPHTSPSSPKQHSPPASTTGTTTADPRALQFHRARKAGNSKLGWGRFLLLLNLSRHCALSRHTNTNTGTVTVTTASRKRSPRRTDKHARGAICQRPAAANGASSGTIGGRGVVWRVGWRERVQTAWRGGETEHAGILAETVSKRVSRLGADVRPCRGARRDGWLRRAVEEEGHRHGRLGVAVRDAGRDERGGVYPEERTEARVFGAETDDLEFTRFRPVNFDFGRRLWLVFRFRLWFWFWVWPSFWFWCWL